MDFSAVLGFFRQEKIFHHQYIYCYMSQLQYYDNRNFPTIHFHIYLYISFLLQQMTKSYTIKYCEVCVPNTHLTMLRIENIDQCYGFKIPSLCKCFLLIKKTLILKNPLGFFIKSSFKVFRDQKWIPETPSSNILAQAWETVKACMHELNMVEWLYSIKEETIMHVLTVFCRILQQLLGLR